MFSHWAYVLVGNNNVGKTSFQRHLVNKLCGTNYQRLPRNLVTQITHRRSVRGWATIFTCNRSYQEKRAQYKSVARYFRFYFEDADVCILASHTNGSAQQDVPEIMRQLKRRCYNVAGVFWSNGFDQDAREMTLLPWDEVLWIANPNRRGSRRIDQQISEIAEQFADMLIARAPLQ
jgi:GTPase SAR1 family protein